MLTPEGKKKATRGRGMSKKKGEKARKGHVYFLHVNFLN